MSVRASTALSACEPRFAKDKISRDTADAGLTASRGAASLERNGVPRSVAQKLVGHRTDAMYQRYAITTEDDLREAVRRVHQPELAVES